MLKNANFQLCKAYSAGVILKSHQLMKNDFDSDTAILAKR